MVISILDYGCGNIASIYNMCRKVGSNCKVISTSKEVLEADALIIPGVGKFDSAISLIDSKELRDPLNHSVLNRGIPVLGICVGMQLMTAHSEEGMQLGFSWVDAQTSKIDVGHSDIRLPHMGWNIVNVSKQHPIFDDDGFPEHRFYFVHSYSIQCNDKRDILATTVYGDTFVSAFSKNNIIGVQFHPEKSHKFGVSLFHKFSTEICNA